MAPSNKFTKRASRLKKRSSAPGGRRSRPRIEISVQLRLWVRSGGRCSFAGCNKILYRDDLTLSELNYSQIAHIVAHKKEGPRGDDPLPAGDREKYPNLMLVCPKHHKTIDDLKTVAKYPKKVLQAYKKEHEVRIERMTSIHPDAKTTVVRLRCHLLGDRVKGITPYQVQEALGQKYPDLYELELDCTHSSPVVNESFFTEKARDITEAVTQHLRPRIDQRKVEHISVFALAPMPLLVHLGHSLGRAIPMDIYKCHSTNGSWTWKKDGALPTFETKLLQRGTDPKRVAVVVSVSGRIPATALPDSIDATFYVYELTVAGANPTPEVARRQESLEKFHLAYHALRAVIQKDHAAAKAVEVFPAMPGPFAVIWGKEHMNADPNHRLYELDKKANKFAFALEIKNDQ